MESLFVSSPKTRKPLSIEEIQIKTEDAIESFMKTENYKAIAFSGLLKYLAIRSKLKESEEDTDEDEIQATDLEDPPTP